MKSRIFYVVIALVLTVALAVPLLSPGTAVTANNGPKTQLAMILDGSFSISESEWNTMINGLAAAVGNSSCVPQDGSVELTIVQFSDNARLEVGPVVITSANVDAVKADILALKGEQMRTLTCIACGICLAADTLEGSPNFNTTLKQALNLVTDGAPNRCIDCSECNGECEGTSCSGSEAETSAEDARDYAISLLQMTDPSDEFDVEGIGITDTNRDWLKNNIIFPATGYSSPTESWPPPGPGWVRVVDTFQDFADTICEKIQIVLEPTGACCDPATGICEDDVIADECLTPLEWSEGELCADLEPLCAPPKGACCNPATGICEDDVIADECLTPLEWSEGELCAELDPLCAPPKGACCYPDGSCADGVIADECKDPLQWTDGVLCVNLEPPCVAPPEELDFGDAPEGGVAYPSSGLIGQFPTCITVGPSTWIQHGLGFAYFGPAWDPETDGNAGLCPGCFPTYDDDECFADGDAGLIVPEPSTIDAGGTVVTCPYSAGTPLGFTCNTATWGTDVDIWVVNNMPSEAVGYVNVLMDWNQDGQWAFDPSTTCPGGPVFEHVVVNFPIPPGYSGRLSLVPGGPPLPFQIGPNPGYVWTRFTISDSEVPLVMKNFNTHNSGLQVLPDGWHGAGEFEDGETEDYLLSVYVEPPPQVVTGVPTLSQWGMISMGILFAAFLIWTVRRRWVVSADGRQE